MFMYAISTKPNVCRVWLESATHTFSRGKETGESRTFSNPPAWPHVSPTTVFGKSLYLQSPTTRKSPLSCRSSPSWSPTIHHRTAHANTPLPSQKHLVFPRNNGTRITMAGERQASTSPRFAAPIRRRPPRQPVNATSPANHPRYRQNRPLVDQLVSTLSRPAYSMSERLLTESRFFWITFRPFAHSECKRQEIQSPMTSDL